MKKTKITLFLLAIMTILSLSVVVGQSYKHNYFEDFSTCDNWTEIDTTTNRVLDCSQGIGYCVGSECSEGLLVRHDKINITELPINITYDWINSGLYIQTFLDNVFDNALNEVLGGVYHATGEYVRRAGGTPVGVGGTFGSAQPKKVRIIINESGYQEMYIGDTMYLAHQYTLPEQEYNFVLRLGIDFENTDGIDNLFVQWGEEETPSNLCRDNFIYNCDVEENDYIVLNESEYNITPTSDNFWDSSILIHQNNVTLDCDGATLYFDKDYYTFLDVQGSDFTLMNCVFDRRYGEEDYDPDGCQCTSTVRIRESSPNWTVTGCDFQNSMTGDSVSIQADYIQGATISWNILMEMYLDGDNIEMFYNTFNPRYEEVGIWNAINGNNNITNSNWYGNNFTGANIDPSHELWRNVNIVENYDNYDEYKTGISLRNIGVLEFSNIVRNDLITLGVKGKTMNVINNTILYEAVLESLDEGEDFVFYGNDMPEGGIEDYTDYNTYNIIYCVNGIGNDIQYYNGGYEWSGTCPPPFCHEEFISGCYVTEDVTLTESEYNITDITINTGNVVIDCQDAMLRGNYDLGIAYEVSSEDYWNDIDNEYTLFTLKQDNHNITIKNCQFEQHWWILKDENQGNWQANNIYFDNINWKQTDDIYIIDWVETLVPRLVMHTGDTLHITNSYFEGSPMLDSNEGHLYLYRGNDYCPNNEGEYVINSENCLSWEYSDVEEECSPEMWNGTQCLDSRGSWHGGNCNECADNEFFDPMWQQHEGNWFYCDYSTAPSNLRVENNIINKTTISENTGDREGYYRMMTQFVRSWAINGGYLINNSFYMNPNNDNSGSDYNRAFTFGGSKNLVIQDNEIYDGTGIDIWKQNDWDTDMGYCSSENVLIENNYVDLSNRENSFWANYIIAKNVTVRDNTFIGPEDKVNLNIGSTDGEEYENIVVENNNIINGGLFGIIVQTWNGPLSNSQIRNNNFTASGVYFGSTVGFENFSLHSNNFVDSAIRLEDSAIDICYSGASNNYLGETHLDLFFRGEEMILDSACPVLNIPNGISLNSAGSFTNFKGNGVVINGTSEIGLTVNGNSSNISNIKLTGFDKSIEFTSYANNNIYKDSEVELPYYDYGNNQFLNLDVPAPVLLSYSGPTTLRNVESTSLSFSVYTIAEIDNCVVNLNNENKYSTSSFAVNSKTTSFEPSVVLSDVPSSLVPWRVTCTDVFGNSVSSSTLSFSLARGGAGGGGSGSVVKATEVVPKEDFLEDNIIDVIKEGVLDARQAVLDLVHPEDKQEQNELGATGTNDQAKPKSNFFSTTIEKISTGFSNFIKSITDFFSNILNTIRRTN